LASITFNAPPLTNHSFKSYSKSKDRAITPPSARATTLNLSPNIFNNKAVPLEINWELKDLSILKEDSFQNTASK